MGRLGGVLEHKGPTVLVQLGVWAQMCRRAALWGGSQAASTQELPLKEPWPYSHLGVPVSHSFLASEWGCWAGAASPKGGMA